MKTFITILISILFLSCSTGKDSEQTAENTDNQDYELLIENSTIDVGALFERKVIKKADWAFVPDVIVCKGVMISQARIDNAIKLWEDLGHEFSEIIQIECVDDEQLLGAIYIMPPQSGYDFNKLSNTHTAYATFADGNKKIIGSWIEIPNRVIQMERVLEHEIGHSLGYQHTSVRFHLMNKDQQKGGFITNGLNAAIK